MTGPSEIDILKSMVIKQGAMLENITRALAPAPAPVPQYSDEELRERPSLVLDAMRRQAEEMIAPLNAAQLEMQRSRTYKNLKPHLKEKHKDLAPIWAQVEAKLDATFEDGKFDVNDTMVEYQLNAIVGSILRTNPNMLSGSKPNIPDPVIPPSGAPVPEPTKKQLRALTDEEEIIRKMRNQTVEQFITGLEDDAPFIVTRGETK